MRTPDFQVRIHLFSEAPLDSRRSRACALAPHFRFFVSARTNERKRERRKEARRAVVAPPRQVHDSVLRVDPVKSSLSLSLAPRGYFNEGTLRKREREEEKVKGDGGGGQGNGHEFLAPRDVHTTREPLRAMECLPCASETANFWWDIYLYKHTCKRKSCVEGGTEDGILYEFR